MRKEKVIVLIPIYKAEITHFEKISLLQCVKILGKYPIKFFAPENLDLKNYFEICPNLSVEVFDPVFFKNIQTYNNLMLSSIFYKRFIGYKYMLIYQLDAFVFRDELEFWCNKGFDYIGSPWFDHNLINNIYQSLFQSKYLLIKIFKRLLFSNKKSFVGNGGLSLRRVKTLYYITKFKFFYKNSFTSNEDIFWGVFVPMFYPFYKLPGLPEALKFSFEEKPGTCFEMNDRQLPFACHGWYKYDLEFYKPFILKEGYDV